MLLDSFIQQICSGHCGYIAAAKKDLDSGLKLVQTNWTRVVGAAKGRVSHVSVCESLPCLWEGISKELFSNVKSTT